MKKQMLRTLLTVVLVAATVLSAAPARAAQVDLKVQKDIEDSLVCQDSCGMILSSCDNQTAQYMRKIITDRLSKGQSKAQIIGYFQSIYGVKVLAAPPAEGFNITAWVTPFVALIGGGLLIYFALDKWVLRAKLERMEREDAQGTEKPVDFSEYEGLLDEELKKYL